MLFFFKKLNLRCQYGAISTNHKIHICNQFSSSCINIHIKYNYLYLTCSFDISIIHFIRVERNSSEELFSPLPTFSTEDLFLKEYCLCAVEASQSGGISGFTDVHCNLTEPMVQCKNTRTSLATTLYQECHKNRRRKRAVDSDDVFDDTPLTYDSNYDPDYLPPVSLVRVYIE